MKKRIQNSIDLVLVGAVAALILTFAVIRHQTVLKTLPTLITLVVQLLTVRASRYSFLLGGINAVLYSISYFQEGLYFSLLSAAAISVPIQIYSFIAWSSKKKSNGTVELKVLGVKRLTVVALVTLAAWLVCYVAVSPLFDSATYPLLDSYLFAAAITVSLLSAWRYVEAQYISIISSVLSLALWILLVIRDPANMNYVIIAAYNLFRIVQAARNWTRKYLEQKKSREASAQE